MTHQFDRVFVDHSPSSFPCHPAEFGLRDTVSFGSRYISVMAFGDAGELGGHMYETQVCTCSKKWSVRLKSSRRASDKFRRVQALDLLLQFRPEARARMIGPLDG